jgi:2-polyprenyl-6-methoxyphenol hydroxylase and related FAD-dependent oxidoreductases
MNKEFDVVIVGGGMVGATVGCCLGGSDLKVAVIEKMLPEAFIADQPHDLRVSALSIASKNDSGAYRSMEGRIKSSILSLSANACLGNSRRHRV